MIVIAVALAFAVGAAATGWLVSRDPPRRLVDHPNERSLHDRPVSRAGGIAILAGMTAGLAIVALMEAPEPVPGYGWLLAGALIIISVSFADDVRRVSPAIRIGFHLAAATCVVHAGLGGERIVLPGAALDLGPATGTVFTVLFVAWLVNLYNFMDGMDGFAGGMTAIGFDHCGRIPEITARTGADVIVIAMPSASAVQRRRIVELCERSDVPMRTIPYMGDLVSGRAVVSELRTVTIEDLLARPPVEFDWPAIRHELTARTVVVTGGGGSIGSELCRQVARLDPSRLVVVDVNESGLHRMEAELRDAYPALPLSIVLADICDTAAVKCIFGRYAPDIVFHAAAYKHVPMLESHMREAVRVNALGTQTMVDAAAEHATGLFVLVSSDKAVNPTNAMGASKRLAEMVCRAAGDASPSSRLITVRFGNVLDSAGSVVPLFREQIAGGGPVTVTDPGMERYFMTIPEACQLIMASTALGKGGDVFVLDMGEPLRIVYLAEQMIRLSGKVPGKDIAIEFIGSRPGEKLSEELIHPGELPGLTRCHEKILLVHGPSVEQAWLAPRLAKLRDACDAFDEPALRRILSELVPEYFRPPPAGETHRTTAASPRRDTSSTAAPRAR